MLLRAAAFLIAQQTDTRPPFWWIGLLASPGGLLIIGAGLAIILVTVMVAWKDRR